MSRNLFWVVAAGTGGHIIPGLEVAKRIEELLKNSDTKPEFVFWGTRDRLEAKLVPQHNRTLKFLVAKPWKGLGTWGKIKGIFSLFFSVWPPVLAIIGGEKPKAVISMGGYVSIPVVCAAILFRIPVFIHEPNIKTGIANRLLGKYAKFITTIPGSDALQLFTSNVFDYGNPVAGGFDAMPIRSQANTILILGGSQGARALCDAGLEVFKELLQWQPSLNLILQAGIKNLQAAEAKAEQLSIKKKCRIYGFVTEMPKLLAVSDIAIARAGAMTLSELSLVGLPTILVPFPYAADDHQRHNARLLEKAKAVRMVEEGEGFEKRLSATLRDLLLSERSMKVRLELSENFKRFARPNAGHDIAEKILSFLSIKY